MPARSQKQARTMRAAAAGADFPLAKKLRQTMTPKQLAEFSHTTPEHKTRAAGKQRAALRAHTESARYDNRSRNNLKRGTK